MYHPTTRLLTVLELLQSRGQLSGAELAQRLEVDRRSVRRYVETLQEIGIPIEGTRGPYGGYRLLPGYKLPPLLFTEDEAVALTLGLVSLRRTELALNAPTVEGALAKIERVLPDAARIRVKAIQTHLALDSTAHGAPVDGALVIQLSEAAAAGRSVVLQYQSQRGETTERMIDPYGVVNWTRSWYVVGYCHLRQAPRMFRLDRIRSAAPNSARFEPPTDFDYLGYVIRGVGMWVGSIEVEVTLGLDIDQARRKMPPGYSALEMTDEGVLFRSKVDDLDWFAGVLLNLHCALGVRKPSELKQALRRAAQRMLDIAGNA